MRSKAKKDGQFGARDAPKVKRQPKGREALGRVMERALKVAKEGGCAGWSDVLAKLGGADEAVLRLWAGASEEDAIERECGKARYSLSSEVREREDRRPRR